MAVGGLFQFLGKRQHLALGIRWKGRTDDSERIGIVVAGKITTDGSELKWLVRQFVVFCYVYGGRLVVFDGWDLVGDLWHLDGVRSVRKRRRTTKVEAACDDYKGGFSFVGFLFF